jgi:hypothetical protein
MNKKFLLVFFLILLLVLIFVIVQKPYHSNNGKKVAEHIVKSDYNFDEDDIPMDTSLSTDER